MKYIIKLKHEGKAGFYGQKPKNQIQFTEKLEQAVKFAERKMATIYAGNFPKKMEPTVEEVA